MHASTHVPILIPAMGKFLASVTWATDNTVALSPSILIWQQDREGPLPLGKCDVVITIQHLSWFINLLF